VQAEVVLEVGRRLLEHRDVGPGAEEPVAGAAHDEDLHRVVHARREDGVVEGGPSVLYWTRALMASV
jgi:hypothetical protein